MSFDFSSDYFAIFGLPVDYELDRDALSERYRELQRTVHPDRYAQASDQERRLAMQRATQINEAYRVLQDPLTRARYLLELQGVAWDDEQLTVQDPAFLMEQMELREALEAVGEGDDALDRAAALIDEVNEHIRVGLGQLRKHFSSADAQDAAKSATVKLQFLYKLRAEAEALEAKLEEDG